jgi:hypothetical protein
MAQETAYEGEDVTKKRGDGSTVNEELVRETTFRCVVWTKDGACIERTSETARKCASEIIEALAQRTTEKK